MVIIPSDLPVFFFYAPVHCVSTFEFDKNAMVVQCANECNNNISLCFLSYCDTDLI